MSLEVLVSVLQQCFVCCLVLSDDSRLALYPLWFSFYSSTRFPFVSSCHLLIRVSLISFVVFISFLCPLVSCHAITRQEIGKEIKRFFFIPSAFNAVFKNNNASGRYGPPTQGSHYTGQDRDGQATLSSGIQQWTVPYSGEYRIEAIGAAGGYDSTPNSSQYRGRGAKMIGTFRLNKGEVIQILVGQEGGINEWNKSSAGGGGTFVVRGSRTPLIIAGGGGGGQSVIARHGGCDASTNTTGNPGYKSWPGGSNGHGAQTADDQWAGKAEYCDDPFQLRSSFSYREHYSRSILSSLTRHL